MKKSVTFTASIYVGLRHGYSWKLTHPYEVREWLKTYCNETKLCVTITPTEFLYVKGSEPGIIVGLINYPRFPEPIEDLKQKAIAIGYGLMELCHQERLSIVFQDETVMLEKDDNQVL